MAVLINGIDVPDYCYHCALCHESTHGDWKIIDWCMPLNREVSKPFEKNKDCPLIEVKEPYGRMIDADELREVIDRGWAAGTWWFTSKVDDAPTLVPSWYTERHVIQEYKEELERLRKLAEETRKDMEEYFAARPIGAFQAEPEERCCCSEKWESDP